MKFVKHPERPNHTVRHPSPTHSVGSLAFLPESCVPYAELFRLHMPMGSLYTYFPCLFGSMLAASLDDPLPQPSHLLYTNTVLLLGAFIVHGSGSTWNDILDRTIDRSTARTKHRPIARNAISVYNAVLFFACQIIIGAGIVLMLLSWECVLWSVPAFIGGLVYPLAKRFTNYPQAVLGSVFSWGVFLAFPALKTTLPRSGSSLLSVISLYIASVSWTVLYDTIYALQDLEDDLKNGVKSTAVRHVGNIKLFLGILAVTELSALALIGIILDFGYMFFLSTCLGSSFVLVTMIWKLDVKDSHDCLWWFSNQCYLVGGTIFTGFAGEYTTRFFNG